MGSKIVLLADNTNILVSEENKNNLQYKLNNIMNELQTWFTLNSLLMLKRHWQCLSIPCRIKSHCYHMLYLKVEIFHITLKQNFWVYTLMKM